MRGPWLSNGAGAVVGFVVALAWAWWPPSANAFPEPEPLYIVIMSHVEGDLGEPEGSPDCPTHLFYQTLMPPPPGQPQPGPTFAVDIRGTEIIREVFLNYHDSYGNEPKLFIEPTGEFWQTEASPVYGNRLFTTYDYQALGYEFGIQGHAIYYSGQNFCWYNSPHTADGVLRKLTDLHEFAQTVQRNGQPVNNALSLTGGWKLEKDALGDTVAEYVIDHVAAGLGYRISFEDHDGHLEDEPPGINGSRASYYVYRADYGDGTRMIKIDFNGGVNASCGGNTPRCETPAEALARFDATLTAKNADTDPGHVYFFAFTTHSSGVWDDYNRAAGGLPMVGEGVGLLALLDSIEARKNAGTQIKYVTPSALAAIFETANPPPTPTPLPYESSPFGFHPASVGALPNLSFAEAQDIGVRWHRPPVYAYWFLIQPDLNSPAYDWRFHDAQYGAVPAGINILANIAPQGPIDEGYSLPGSYLPVDDAKYQAFVRAAVERYDGDGVADMPGLVAPIRYWQVGNEPGVGPDAGRTDFAQLQTLTYTAIKDACPNCHVLIGGATGFPADFVNNFLTNYAPILAELNGQYVDIFDFHWYGNATGDYRLLGDALAVIRAKLTEYGFGNIRIWVTEMGTYSGDPVDFPFGALPYQSEEQQAADLLKRFVYPVSLGIEKVFPALGLIEGFIDNDGYFSHTGLIYDGQGSNDRGLGVKKVGYYTYKLMTQKLEGTTFDSALTGLPASVYGYAFTDSGGVPITVRWYDDFAGGPPTQDVTLTTTAPSVLVTNAVTGQQGDITTTVLPVSSGSVTLTLGQSPVFVQSQDTPTLPPVFVTVVSHNEEPGAGRPDYTADVNYYLQNRNLVKLLAETITNRGAAFNFQSDWNFLKAVAMYDTGIVISNTAGKNIVRWMHEDLGVEVDPHAHETQYNYADVAYLIEQLGVTPSKNVGGFLYSPPDNSQGWEKHIIGMYGAMYPAYFWIADNLWGAATLYHQGNDDASSGIWRPKDRYNFYVDDPNQRLVYIGGGCGGEAGLVGLLDSIVSGEAPPSGFYTANLMMIQDWMTAQSIAQLGSFIDSVAPLVAQGRVQWSSLTQTANQWKTTYGAQPFRYACDTLTAPSSYTTETVERWVAAPNGNLLYTRIIQPVPALYPGQRFPALIAIPGGTGAGAPLADNSGYRDLAASGFIVVVFNPEGRGTGQPGNLISQGVENCNGFTHQDDLKAIVEYTAALANVNAANIGVQTGSFGIAIGAGALGRYPDLPVAYLVDMEGPHDNRCITFYDAGHEVAVCGHLSTVTDPSPSNVAFWTEREAVRYIKSYPGRYMRVQAQVDHAQNPGYFRHTIEMIDSATQRVFGGGGICCWTRVNGSDVGNSINTVYPYDNPAQYPTWLSGRLNPDHLGLEFTYIREMSDLAATTPCSPAGCDCTYFGDLDLDGRINPIDMVYIINFVYKQMDMRRQQPNCPGNNGDWNCDGNVNPVDVVRYVNYIYKGQTDRPPCNPCDCAQYPPRQGHPEDCPPWPPSTK